MKKLTIVTIFLFLLGYTSMAGGILTNANQSAQYVRMFSRNASTTFDAVYFNPAGLMKMENGFHFSLNNQTIFQTRTITTEALLNRSEYIGDVSAPVFPSAFAIYKIDDIAFSLGFGPNGGGGSADFKNGLPSFEGGVAEIVPALSGLSALGYNVTGYDVDIAFKGQSVFWGIQAGVSARLSDQVSVYGGARILPSTETYTGTMSDIMFTINGQPMLGQSTLNEISGVASGLSQAASAASVSYSGAATSVQQLITAGAGSYTLSQVQTAGYITSAQYATFVGALSNLGLTSAQIAGLTMNQVKPYFSDASSSYAATATQLSQTSATLAATATQLGDKEVDAKRTGMGFSPIIGINISPSDNLNIGMKYEFKTKLELENETTKDDIGLFPDGKKSSSDIPAILTAGVDYWPTERLLTSASLYYYFDKGVDWGNNIYEQARTIDSNSWELALGLQYNITDKVALSGGYMYSPTGVSEDYQSDFSYSNSANSVAFGVEWKINDRLVLDAGVFHTQYIDAEKSFGSYNETYDKVNTGFAIGLGYSIF